MDEMNLRELIALYERFPARGDLRVHTDTTEFMDLRSGEVLKLPGNYYLIRGEETEKRFGLEDEPKYWVKRAIDLSDGTAKIIKLVHREIFTYHINGQTIRCFSSAMKEARVLYKIKGDPSFMQGFSTLDDSGNLVRVIDRIQGESFYEHIKSIEMGHEEYFYNCFPAIFRKILFCIEAVGRLHWQGERHGDIRADHLLIERKTDNYIWIDFNYDYEWPERPCGLDLFGLRNILLCAAGKGFHTAFDNKFNSTHPFSAACWRTCMPMEGRLHQWFQRIINQTSCQSKGYTLNRDRGISIKHHMVIPGRKGNPQHMINGLRGSPHW